VSFGGLHMLIGIALENNDALENSGKKLE